MKHLYTTLLVAFCLSASARAQAQESSPALKTEAVAATRQLAALISLDDARQLPVRRLTQVRLTQEADARQTYSNDPDMLQKKLLAIGQEYTQQLGQLLTPAQYQRYLAAAPGALPATVAAVPLPAPAPAAPVAQIAPNPKPLAAKPKPTAHPAKAAARR